MLLALMATRLLLPAAMVVGVLHGRMRQWRAWSTVRVLRCEGGASQWGAWAGQRSPKTQQQGVVMWRLGLQRRPLEVQGQGLLQLGAGCLGLHW